MINPLYKTLADLPQKILLAGAGGGFDIYSGIPIYHWLKALGKDVVLANLSFSSLQFSDADQVFENVYKVGPNSDGPTQYFPELYLAQFLETEVYAFRREGVANLTRSYEWLVEYESIDAVVLVDGGTDSLMRGDEPELGTPLEDLSSLWAANRCGVPAILAAIGFGIDTFHGVCHYYFLEAVAELTAAGFLGSIHLLPDTPGVAQFSALCEFAFAKTDQPSIVASHILAGIHGEYGDVHPTKRTRGNKVWINPLMGIYWGFELEAVVNRHLFIEELASTETMHELMMALQVSRSKMDIRDWEELHC